MAELVVVSVERKDPRAGLEVESLLVEPTEGLERMRPSVCKNISASSSERQFSAARERWSASLLLRSSRETGSPDAERRTVKRRERLGGVASRINDRRGVSKMR